MTKNQYGFEPSDSDPEDFASDSDPEFVGDPLSAAEEARLARELELSLPSFGEQIERRAMRTLEVAANILAIAEAEPYVPPEDAEYIASEVLQNNHRLTRSRTRTDPQAHADLVYWQNMSEVISHEDSNEFSESD